MSNVREELIKIINDNRYPIGDSTEKIVNALLAREKRIVASIVEPLEKAFDALDGVLGDTDPEFPEGTTEDEIREEEPVFWACCQISEAIKRAKELTQ